MVARISDDYRPERPVVGKDIPGPAVPCHVGTARLLETVNTRTRSVGRAVRRPYSDSDESENDVLYFKCFLPAEERAGDLTAAESEIEMSDSKSRVEYVEPDSTHVQTETAAQQLPSGGRSDETYGGLSHSLAPAIVLGRDVLMEDGAVAVDTGQVSAASDSVVSREVHGKS